MNFKEAMESDIATFLSLDEFGESYTVELFGVSKTLSAVLDADTEEKPAISPDGLVLITHKFYVRESDLPKVPQRGKEIKVDGQRYLVTDIAREGGMLVLMLEVYDG